MCRSCQKSLWNGRDRHGRWVHRICVFSSELLRLPWNDLYKSNASKRLKYSFLGDTVARDWMICARRFGSALSSSLRVGRHWMFNSRKIFGVSRLRIDFVLKSGMSHDIWLLQERPLRCLETSGHESLSDATHYLGITKILVVTLRKPKI
jgi:hypothetical protein